MNLGSGAGPIGRLETGLLLAGTTHAGTLCRRAVTATWMLDTQSDEYHLWNIHHTWHSQYTTHIVDSRSLQAKASKMAYSYGQGCILQLHQCTMTMWDGAHSMLILPPTPAGKMMCDSSVVAGAAAAFVTVYYPHVCHCLCPVWLQVVLH